MVTMKTIAEINQICPYHPNEWQQGYGIWQAGFIEGEKVGAIEQKTIDDEEYRKDMAYTATKRQELIDKACEWLKNNLPITTEEEARSLHWKVITPDNLNVLICDFKKAIED